MKNPAAESIERMGEPAAIASGPQSFDEIVQGCQRGDRGAQHALYERLRNDVYHVVLRMVGESDAPDLLQQSFVRVFRTIGQFANQSHIRTWLYRIAVNECLQHLRRTKARASLPLELDPIDPSPGQDVDLENKELLERALSRLEPELRAVFVLREVEQMTYARIAETLQLQEGTVASRLNHARRKLQEILTDLGWEQ